MTYACLFIYIPVAILFAGGVFSYLLNFPLPYPYEHLNVLPLPRQYRENGAFNGTSLSPMQFARVHGARVIELNKSNTRVHFHGQVFGSETVALYHEGNCFDNPNCSSLEHGNRLIMIDKYGIIRIASVDHKTGLSRLSSKSLYVGPGRSLGFHQVSCDEIVVCDSVKGLLLVNISHLLYESVREGDHIRILTNSVTNDKLWRESNAINYANDLDVINANGSTIIYFTSSTTFGVVSFNSQKHFFDTMRSFLLTMLSGDVSGRLLQYNVSSKKTKVVMENIYYANGVAVAADNSFVLVVETVGLRVWKHYLSGAKSGQCELFIDKLPGFPDGISRSVDGKSFYISLVGPLSPIFSKGSHVMQSSISRWISAWILTGSWTSSVIKKLGILKSIGCVLKVSDTGRIEEMFLDQSGSTVSTISGVAETSNGLFFGNLDGDSVVNFVQSK